MGIFRFKKFDVVNERSAMKVNTDGVLLGASMTLKPSDCRLLDVGTGTGTIALMSAQRLAALKHDPKPVISIDAIDIDEVSVEEAAVNFSNSPWPELLQAHHSSLEAFSRSLDSDVRYDQIFSNPPYFEDSLLAPEERRSNARHTSTGLSYRELLDFASARLSEGGRMSVVLPAEQEASLCRYARMCGLHLFRIVRVKTVPRKNPSRIIAEFCRTRCMEPEDIVLTIQKEGKYTEEYLSLTREFYLFA
jgi:tRNA1Val (adenine37-N6)-methyltransferase